MAKKRTSGKRLMIDKANSTMLIVVGVSAFVVTFSLVAGKALLSQRAYQSRVISAKKKANTQLEANIAATTTLENSYKAFVGTSDNIIGGNPSGTGERDGDNAKIVLDALPSKYDYPALASSLEKIITSKSHNIKTITGTDDEVAQSSEDAKPVPVEMPFEVQVSGTFGSNKDLMAIFEKSIRPIRVKSLQLTSVDNGLDVTIDAVTYYQPAKTLKIETTEIK
jgi:hypothetical protein